jgi:adenylosuccinate synthase
LFLKDEKTYLKTNQLPLGWMFSKDVQIRIGSGVAVNPDWLLREMRKYGLQERVKVDFRCPIITQEHMDKELNSKAMSKIGSTFSGTGYCRSDFILRRAKQARHIDELAPYLTDLSAEINQAAATQNIVVESSQGTFLSLAISEDYPNTTSDNVTTAAAIDDVLLNWRKVAGVVLVVKALPSREGAGSMGAEELSEQEIIKSNLEEISSIGGAIRRKARGINWDLLKYAVEVNGATEIALTFCDHYDPDVTNITEYRFLPGKIKDLIGRVEAETNLPVTLLNTGKSYNSIVDLTDRQIDWDMVEKNLHF